MDDSRQELTTILDNLQQLIARGNDEIIQAPLRLLENAAEAIGKAWCGSWVGFHANVYYKNLNPPPPGTHFNVEWGFRYGGSEIWIEYDATQIVDLIHQSANNPDTEPICVFKDEAIDEFSRQQRNLLSIIEIEFEGEGSSFLARLKEELDGLSILSEDDFVRLWLPSTIKSRDRLASSQGIRTPPHLHVLSQVQVVRHTIDTLRRLINLTRDVALHVARRQRRPQLDASIRTPGTRVFLGHGRSQTWRELKDFLEDRLGLLVDEFNRVPVAGMTNASRLSAMLDSAGLALLVLTGEDEQPDGKFRARENVIHEAGLFQGRLGFERSIVLLEEGCEEFSNIHGLGHIPFPKGDIRAAFESIREVLEREGMLRPGK